MPQSLGTVVGEEPWSVSGAGNRGDQKPEWVEESAVVTAGKSTGKREPGKGRRSALWGGEGGQKGKPAGSKGKVPGNRNSSAISLVRKLGENQGKGQCLRVGEVTGVINDWQFAAFSSL